MEIEALTRIWKLSPPASSLLLAFLQFRREPRSRLAHLARLEPKRVPGALDELLARGLVEKATGSDRRFGLVDTPTLESLARRAAERPDVNADRLELELEVVREVRSTIGRPAITVISPRERAGADGGTPPPRAISDYLRALFPYLDLRLGTRCNFNCRYCLLGHEKRGTRGMADIEADLQHGRRLGLESLSLTGGEPSLHPEILRIVRRARALGYRRIILVTNGSLLGEGRNLERLTNAGVDAVGFSFDAPNRSVSRRLWRRDAYARVLEGIRRVMARDDLVVGSISVLTRLNMHFLPELVRLLAHLAQGRRGLYLPAVDFVMPEENAWAQRRTLVPRLREAEPHLRAALDEARRLGLPLSFRGMPACIMPAHREWDMERHMTIFDVVDLGERSHQHRAGLDLLRHKPPRCEACRHRRGCLGVYRAYANLYGTSELRPVPFSGKEVNACAS
ncbi:MAG: radical SAM protein [Myxococcota bacterium]|nr:radical SAM protein [Myxococcota bacterium]